MVLNSEKKSKNALERFKPQVKQDLLRLFQSQMTNLARSEEDRR
jgi:flagellar basal body-associated protein FliL